MQVLVLSRAENIRFLYPDAGLEGIHHFYFAS